MQNISFNTSGRGSSNFRYHINNFSFPTVHSHKDYWEFTIVQKGTVKNVTKNEEVVCDERTLFFMATGDVHCLKKVSSDIQYLNIAVYEPYLINLLNAIDPNFKDRLISSKRYFKIPNDLSIKIDELLYKSNVLRETKITLDTDVFCSIILLLLQFIHENGLNLETDQPTWIRKLNELSFSPEFLTYTVSDICEKLCYSKAQLCRLFKQHLHMTPHEYVNEYKLKYAKNLILTSDIPVSKIAVMVGFSDLSHFNNNFKKEYGITPGAYRKGKNVENN